MNRIADNLNARRRRGATVVESATVLPLCILVVWGMFEFARLMVGADTLIMAAQEGCRAGITPGSTSADVQAAVSTVLSDAFISGATTTTTPAEAATLKTGDELRVTVKVPFAQITWLPVPQFLNGRVITTSCTMLREGK